MAAQTVAQPSTKNPPGARPGFRLDIEGLRGLAIFMVILAHLGVGIHGGVDVSFALSGFLVTLLLLQEKAKTGSIAFAKFYARRARRLLPAATLVTLATLAGAYLWMSPLRLQGVAKDGFFASVSFINWKLAADGTDYFANKALSPFQHFWSLSVEEQFYVFGPLVILGALWLARKYGNIRHASVVLVCLAVMSLGASIIWTNLAQPWAYFGTHTRAWELLFGAALAIWANDLKRLPETVAAILSWAGLAVIIGTGIMITEQTPLPGYAVGGPVLGALMVMAGGCANPAKGAVQLLGLGSLRYIGRISYSLYLWHWPIVVILPDITGRPLNVTDKLVVAALTFVLSVLTFHLLERPIRERKSLTTQPSNGLTLGGLLMTGTASACTFVMFFLSPINTAAALQAPTAPVGQVEQLVAEGAKLKQLSPQIMRAVPAALTDGLDDCITKFEGIEPNPCTIGDTNGSITMALVGDSHATHWKPALDAIAKKRGIKLVTYAKANCTGEPYSNVDFNLKRRYTECEEWRDKVYSQVEQLRPAAVILSSAIYDGASGEATAEIVQRIKSWNAKVVMFDDTPRPFMNVPECLSKNPNQADKCAVPWTTAMYKQPLRDARKRAVQAGGGTFVDVEPWFCTSTVCPPVINGMVVYMDHAHVTATYARWLAPKLEQALTPVLN
jgi:peptidoglycan/LPS O-acetylase OafA/YrhL